MVAGLECYPIEPHTIKVLSFDKLRLAARLLVREKKKPGESSERRRFRACWQLGLEALSVVRKVPGYILMDKETVAEVRPRPRFLVLIDSVDLR
jgi:hypothetical protein